MVDALEATLDAVADGILLLDEEGRVSELNRAAADLLGRRRHEILGQSLESLLPEIAEQPSRAGGAASRALAAGSRVEIVTHRGDGSIVPLEVALGQGHGEGRTVLVALLHDLTDHHRHERHVHRQRERLAAALLTATLGEAAAAISHEINQPLAAIANYAQACRHMVERDPSRAGSVLSILEKIGTQAQRAGEELRRFRRLVDYRSAEGEPAPMERIDLNALLRETVQITALESSEDEPSIELDLDPALPSIEGRRLELQAVVLGLLRNVLAGTAPASPRPVLIRTRRTAQRVLELTITDGDEVPAHRGEGELGSPFVSTHHGTIWMGTAVIQSILAAHAGELAIDRNAEGRTTYRVTLSPAP